MTVIEGNFSEEVVTPEIAPPFSEEAIALEFAAEHAGHLRYVAKWGRWYLFDGKRWTVDEKRTTYTLARRVCRETAELAAQTLSNRSNSAKNIASSKTRAAIVSLASDDERLAATFDQWDADPWLLNTPAGVVDLRTGIIRPHRPDHYMTKMTAVAPDAYCPTPLWTAFLQRATGNDDELINYLKRVGGYALTGVTREHAMFFLYGTGRNGKGVLLNTIADILGEYHVTAPIATFIASNNDRHPTDQAGLHGARMVTASETESGLSWDEALIKRITGGDPISARFMRQDFFTYIPQFKLMIAGNNKPRLKSVDEAIKSRMNLILFNVTIPAAERDTELHEKLKEEWPGILAWLVEGCLEWQRQRLAPPEAVIAATADYLASENNLRTWIDECCILDVNALTLGTHLFSRWRDWAELANETVGTNKDFYAALETFGIAKTRRTAGKVFSGIALNLNWRALAVSL